MKKVLITVLVLFLLLGVAAVTAGYFFVYRPGKAYLASFAQLQELPKLDAQVRNRASFAPPSSGELTEERVQRFVATQRAVKARLGAAVEQLESKYRMFKDTPGEPDRQPSTREVIAAVKDLAALVLEAKRAQVEALNAQNFSLEEYDWTRSAVYSAAGIPVDLRFYHALQDAAAGRVPELASEATPVEREIPEKNRALVAPHADQLVDLAPLVFFGL